MAVPLYYDIPIFIFIILAIATIYKLIKVKSYMSEGKLKESYVWLLTAVILLTLWGVDHVYHDLIDLGNLEIFFHYIVSHGFLLAAILALYMCASKLDTAHKDLLDKLGVSRGSKKKK